MQIYIMQALIYSRHPQASSIHEQNEWRHLCPRKREHARSMSLLQHFKRTFFLLSLLSPLTAFGSDLRAEFSPSEKVEVADIINKMEAGYAGVEAYQTQTEVTEYRDGHVSKTERFLYSFKKPDHLRIDMQSPHPGWVLVYPDSEGEVSVKPGGWLGSFKFRLSPDSNMLSNSAGQRIDRTDLGLLIANIAHSLTDRRRGELEISLRDNRIVIRVLSQDHFLPGVLTLYRFSIDRALWLPVEVEEFTPEGIIKRKVIFRNLKTSVNLPEGFFSTK